MTILPSRTGYSLDTSAGKKTSDTVMIADSATPTVMANWNFGSGLRRTLNATRLPAA